MLNARAMFYHYARSQPEAHNLLGGFAPACGSLRDPIETQGHLLRVANVHELRIEKETGCELD